MILTRETNNQKLMIKVVILPMWDKPVADRDEAIERGNLTLQYIRYSENMEKTVKDLIISGYQLESNTDPRD
jgi:hypothetical protein